MELFSPWDSSTLWKSLWDIVFRASALSIWTLCSGLFAEEDVISLYPILRSFQTPRNRVVAKWCILQFEVTISKFLSNVLFCYFIFIYLIFVYDACYLLSGCWLCGRSSHISVFFLGLKIFFKLFCYLWCCFSGNKLNSITSGNGMHVLSWSCGRNVHMKRSFCVYSLFGGKKENNEKNDDAPSKVCSENFVTVDVHRFLIYIYIYTYFVT